MLIKATAKTGEIVIFDPEMVTIVDIAGTPYLCEDIQDAASVEESYCFELVKAEEIKPADVLKFINGDDLITDPFSY